LREGKKIARSTCSLGQSGANAIYTRLVWLNRAFCKVATALATVGGIASSD